MEELSMMQKFADPELFETLSLAEKLEGAGVTTLMGMGITFIVLMFLWAIIAQMAKFSGGTPKGPKSEAASSAPTAAVSPTAPAAPAKAEAAEDSGQLIAVITAALAAIQEGTGSASNLIIRKISRVSGPSTSWSAAGSADAINSRKF